MREVNLHGVDLNLLPALEALLRRRNVSQAAVDASLSQPAMSRALARLRLLFDDPLLVRIAGGFVLSPKAEGLLLRVQAALQDVTSVFAEPAFDPPRCSAVFVLQQPTCKRFCLHHRSWPDWPKKLPALPL
jgi:DNA-binding transcriptional LysR family regulator